MDRITRSMIVLGSIVVLVQAASTSSAATPTGGFPGCHVGLHGRATSEIGAGTFYSCTGHVSFRWLGHTYELHNASCYLAKSGFLFTTPQAKNDFGLLVGNTQGPAPKDGTYSVTTWINGGLGFRFFITFKTNGTLHRSTVSDGQLKLVLSDHLRRGTLRGFVLSSVGPADPISAQLRC